METLDALFDLIEGFDDQARVTAYLEVLNRKDRPEDVYSQWSRFAALLTHPNNHIRSIGGQLYSHFASSDPEGRIWDLWDTWKAVAADKMFVTGRHTIQTSHRLALAGDEPRKRVLDYYQERFHSCRAEKNTTLIRYDLQVCLRQVYDQRPDPSVAALARSLITEESDPKYQAKYKTAWRKVLE